MSKSTKKHPTEDDQQFTITVEPEVISEGECVIVKQISTGCSVDTAGSTSNLPSHYSLLTVLIFPVHYLLVVVYSLETALILLVHYLLIQHLLLVQLFISYYSLQTVLILLVDCILVVLIFLFRHLLVVVHHIARPLLHVQLILLVHYLLMMVHHLVWHPQLIFFAQ